MRRPFTMSSISILAAALAAAAGGGCSSDAGLTTGTAGTGGSGTGVAGTGGGGGTGGRPGGSTGHCGLIQGIEPNGDAAAEMIPGGRCGSNYAMHVTGHGFSMWAVMSVSMGWGAMDGGTEGLLPNNNSFRTGVTFWARIGDTSSDKVRLAFT